MILGFQYFHPLKGTPPETESWTGFSQDIVLRARALLTTRTLKEIRAAIRIINWMLDHSPVHKLRWQQLEKIAKLIDSGGGDIPSPPFIPDNSTYDLKACHGKFDIADYDDFPNAKWHELFAILALSLINEACEEEQYYGSWGDKDDFDFRYEWRIVTHVMPWLIEAMDAVATAEGLYHSESTINDAKRKVSLRNQKAAIQRHSKTNEALLDLFDKYSNGSFKSMRHAAQLYCERHPEKTAHLAHHNCVRTLSEGLSKLIKNKRPSLKK